MTEYSRQDEIAKLVEDNLVERLRDIEDNKAMEMALRYLEKTAYMPLKRVEAPGFEKMREALDRRPLPFPVKKAGEG